MPKSNARYPFEFRALEKVGELGNRLFGEDRVVPGFILELDEHGQPGKSVGAEQNPGFLEFSDEFDSYILLDVFDDGAYVYLNWKNVEKECFQALLGLVFSDEDFVGYESKDDKPFPTAHSVMF